MQKTNVNKFETFCWLMRISSFILEFKFHHLDVPQLFVVFLVLKIKSNILFAGTYAGRRKRSVDSEEFIDVAEAEKLLVEELGEKVCIYPKVCLHHAQKAVKTGGRSKFDIDWDEIFSHYKSPSEKHKEFYLLSAFIGDIIGSPKFCHQLVKRGRICED